MAPWKAPPLKRDEDAPGIDSHCSAACPEKQGVFFLTRNLTVDYFLILDEEDL